VQTYSWHLVFPSSMGVHITNDKSVTVQMGFTAQQIAEQRGHKAVVEYFTKHQKRLTEAKQKKYKLMERT
jgi:hypothetical protein